MKICLVTDTYNPYFDGGAGIYVEDLAREMSQAGHHVSVVTTTEFRGLDSLSFQEERVSASLSVFRLYPLNLYHKTAYRRHSFAIKPFWYAIDTWNPHSYIAFTRLAQREQWDIVHTNNVGSLSFSIFSAIKKLHLPWVHTIHDYAFLCPRSTLYRSSNAICENSPWPCRLFRLSKRLSWVYPELILAPSRFALDVLAKHGFLSHRKTGVLPLGIPFIPQHLDEMSHHRRHKNITSDTKLKLLFLGRIDVFKGTEWLLRTFASAPVPGVELHIAGTGPQATQLKDRYQNAQVIFHGYVQGRQKDALLRACDVLIIPSLWYEIAGIVAYEALTYGMPVLASKIGGIPELVRDGETGYLFEPNNDHALIGAMQKIALDGQLLQRMNNRCLEVAAGLHIRNHVDHLIGYYTDCMRLRTQRRK